MARANRKTVFSGRRLAAALFLLAAGLGVDGKTAHAQATNCSDFPNATLDGFVTPIVTNNFNYPAPTGDSPSLLSLTNADTFFHEFGHALHGMFSNVRYESLAGTSVPRDFVEIPSQVMEKWMRQPVVLGWFANHYETGEPIPQDVIDKINASATFNQGFATV